MQDTFLVNQKHIVLKNVDIDAPCHIRPTFDLCITIMVA
jgi:hypothetical protein